LIDRAKIKAEQRLDGKYLLSTSDPELSAEDVALGYKNLLQAERGFRDLKTTIELRPVFHRLEHRIRAHILLSWLALLLIGITERQTSRRGAASPSSYSACTSSRSPARPARCSRQPASPTHNARS
jgi:transposase